MIVAALSTSGARRVEDFISALARAHGQPSGLVRRGRAALVGWDRPGGLQFDEQDAWCAEGWIDGCDGPLKPWALDHLRGDFALVALHDEGVLITAGQGGGYRPIYVGWPSPELVVVGTRLAPLLRAFASRPELDIDHLAACVADRYPPPESTPYSSIRRLRPGQAWLLTPGNGKRRWSTFVPLLAPQLSVDNLGGELLNAITDATTRASRGARRLGVLASGGLDSSLLLSLAASLASRGQLPEPPLAIACEFAAPNWHDDRPYLRSLERHLGIRALRVTPTDASQSIAQMFVVDAMPANPSDSVWAASCIGAMARTQKADVLLSGYGGDDLNGDPRLFGELARSGHLIQAVSGALRTRGSFREGAAGRLARFVVRPMMESFMPRSLLRALRRWRNGPPAWAGHRLAPRMHATGTLVRPTASLGESPAGRYERMLKSNSLRSWILTRPQEEVVGGYELRAPFFDDEFLRFVATLPPLSLMRGGYLRGLMRAAMRDMVPDELRLRETKGTWFWFVQQAITAAGGMDILRGLADTRELAALGLVQPRAFLAFFDDFASDSREHADFNELWRVLSVEAFLRANPQALKKAA